MKTIKLFALVFIIANFFLMSCSKNNPNDINDYLEEIELGKALNAFKPNIFLSSVAETIQYIPLETKEECIIDRIEKIVFSKNYIFISGKWQFFQFTKEGKFIRSFGAKGKGPGEYLRISDFSINPDDERVVIYDNELKKIITYNFFGEFEDENQISNFPSKVAHTYEGALGMSWVFPTFFYNKNFNINIYSRDGKVIKQMMDRSSEGVNETNFHKFASTSCTRFEYFNDTLSFYETNSDLVFRVLDDGTLMPRFQIIKNFDQKIEERNNGKIVPEQFRTCDFIETGRYIFMPRGLYKNNLYHVCYDKKTKEIISFRLDHSSKKIQLETGFINDIDGGYPFLPSGVISADEVYDTFFASDLKKIQSDDFFKKAVAKESKESEILTNLLSKSELEDNPIIMIVKLKGV